VGESLFPFVGLPSMERRREVGNRLLLQLPADELKKLAAQLELVTVRPREVLSEFGWPEAHLHFPISCVATLVLSAGDGSRSAGATIGNDGVVGVGMLLGGGALPGRVEVQIPGACFRAPEAAVRGLARPGTGLHGVMLLYVQALLAEVALRAACRCAHAAEQRLACGLLLVQDRAAVGRLPLTQDTLATLVGVRRETVSHTATRLQDEGCIRYARGQLRIVDRPALQRAACECYGLIRGEYDRLLGVRG